MSEACPQRQCKCVCGRVGGQLDSHVIEPGALNPHWVSEEGNRSRILIRNDCVATETLQLAIRILLLAEQQLGGC